MKVLKFQMHASKLVMQYCVPCDVFPTFFLKLVLNTLKVLLKAATDIILSEQIKYITYINLDTCSCETLLINKTMTIAIKLLVLDIIQSHNYH